MSDHPGETKLTRTKQRWAAEGKFLTGDAARSRNQRLPPGQHLVTNWPVLDLGQQPVVSTSHWKLDIGGAVTAPQVWNWAKFLAQPQVRAKSDIHCVTTWSRYDNDWTGVSTRHLIEAAEVTDEAAFVVLTSHDGYTTNMAIEDFASPDALMAHSWQGEPLTLEHGAPARLVVPHLYFWKSPKWLRRIEFTTVDHKGFWEVRGYHNHADPWAEERYSED